MQEGRVSLLFLFSLLSLLSLMNSYIVQVNKQHFVFVHGACHGAWCWYKVETLLRSAGHKVTSLDMSASGIDPKQLNDVKSDSDYVQPLTKFMESVSIDERVILVGHSYGGQAISRAMESFPDKIFVAVFIAASMPGPALSVSAISEEGRRHLGSQMDNQFGYDQGPNKPPTSFCVGPNFMSTNLYQLCSPEDLTLATKLVRPLPLFRDESKEIILSDENYGSVSRAFIVTDEDKMVKTDLQRWIIKKNSPDKVIEIEGSDHMVMLSRSKELYACLQEIAEHFS